MDTNKENMDTISTFICNNFESMIKYIVQTYLENSIGNGKDNSTVEILTVNELADLLKISKPIAYDLAARNDFPSFRIGKTIRIYKSELVKWIIEQSAYRKGD